MKEDFSPRVSGIQYFTADVKFTPTDDVEGYLLFKNQPFEKKVFTHDVAEIKDTQYIDDMAYTETTIEVAFCPTVEDEYPNELEIPMLKEFPHFDYELSNIKIVKTDWDYSSYREE